MRHWLAALLVTVATSVAAQSVDNRLSSERIAADPAGQYLLVKKVVGALAPPVGTAAPRSDPEGYDVAGLCWDGGHVLGDWAKRAELPSRLVMLALETTGWSRRLGRGGYPEKPLAEAIGRYEAAMIAAGATDVARERGLDAFLAELVVLHRASPGSLGVRKAGGCANASQSVQIRGKTVPEGGRARFIPKVLYEVCRAQGLDANDITRCDYWMESPDAEPRFFIGEIVWQARWPDGITTTGEFDAGSVGKPGVVTLRQKR